MTYEKKEAIREIRTSPITIANKLQWLSEPALKGAAFEAREIAKVEMDGPLWPGVAEAAAARQAARLNLWSQTQNRADQTQNRSNAKGISGSADLSSGAGHLYRVDFAIEPSLDRPEQTRSWQRLSAWIALPSTKPQWSQHEP